MHKHLSLTAGSRGFTLLEVLLAVMILGLSVSAILYQFQVALRAGSKSREETEAVHHAKEKLEELKAQKKYAESFESGGFDDGYAWETEVIPYVAPADDEEAYEGMKHETFLLRARVKWGPEERQRQVELATLKTVLEDEWD